ncbi:MAG: hypothetical protein A2675_01900 [Candidatus Yonathbacteria bacterium RIFCSPHIGHO2_01_FULL_51_10]|uniref:DUF4395 domain-containing protein n=1 Tax=Candidatus Yonathbacteria bacterium RIFCSPHIGHO2_01_FULL_51_10 TaxID=1802723 RepID=A0A1G2SA13_9BACT|nr:MAG: hypothetical protein A2675_01900 [Candidatus Yonathbacteria bacterium RIFCSPHIGHO2_01_FULL_51_10]
MLNNTACNNLDEQGYTFLSVEEKSKLNIAFRITPTLCILVVIAGMISQSWQVFAVLMTFGILGSATNRFQPFDVLYNVALRHVLKSPKLPPSPIQKRFACGVGALFLFGATTFFYLGSTTWGYVFGAMYIVAAGLMATTHWCVASWLYNKMFKRVA